MNTEKKKSLTVAQLHINRTTIDFIEINEINFFFLVSTLKLKYNAGTATQSRHSAMAIQGKEKKN